MPASGIHWTSPLKKGDRRAKATLQEDVSRGRSVRQAWSPFLSSDWAWLCQGLRALCFFFSTALLVHRYLLKRKEDKKPSLKKGWACKKCWNALFYTSTNDWRRKTIYSSTSLSQRLSRSLTVELFSTSCSFL